MNPLIGITKDMLHEIEPLRFSAPVTHVYNPLVYAWAPHELYLRKFGEGRKEAVLLGMNPGPWGMAQTGVPFGEIELVRDWMGVEAPVGKPEIEHPKRPIEGFGCARSEVSGRRLWGWARERFQTPEAFFERFFVINFCPLCFMEENGRNFTPDKLPAAESAPLIDACSRALRRMVETLEPRCVVGVGGFAEKQARAALEGAGVTVGKILHPSPASPAANKGWALKATRELLQLGIKV
ncbi:MAG: single-stranded DNA-binding protein [bacterium]|nr:single-stranded DNA-binding protein [bacterium]